jgi:hypothetical protein
MPLINKTFYIFKYILAIRIIIMSANWWLLINHFYFVRVIPIKQDSCNFKELSTHPSTGTLHIVLKMCFVETTECCRYTLVLFLPSNCVISANGGKVSGYLYSKINWHLFRHGSTIFWTREESGVCLDDRVSFSGIMRDFWQIRWMWIVWRC